MLAGPRTQRNKENLKCLGSTFFFLFCIFLYSTFLLVIHFTHISVYMSIPISQFIPPPPPPSLSPLGVHTFVLYICVSISALQTGSSVPFSRFHICHSPPFSNTHLNGDTVPGFMPSLPASSCLLPVISYRPASKLSDIRSIWY